MIVGYARTSTIEQVAGFEAQVKELKAVGCEKIFREQVSSATLRIQLQAALEFLREGDVLATTKLDRLARSVADLMVIIQVLEEKQVGLRVLNLGMDTQTPTGRLMLTVLGGIAQFEREMMLERQREGIAKAKAEGKYRGRKPIASGKRDAILQLAASGRTKAQMASSGVTLDCPGFLWTSPCITRCVTHVLRLMADDRASARFCGGGPFGAPLHWLF
jgi:DNA invertase Pin-like site-specific DNA recombinase